MTRRLVIVEPRKLKIENFELPPLRESQVKVKSIYTGISHGTEITEYRGTHPYFHKRIYIGEHLTELKKFPAESGYEGVGTIVETGKCVRVLQEGDIVAATYPHRDYTILDEKNAVKVPDGVTPEEAVFMALGCVALNGINQSGIKLGDEVAVFGQGVVGMLIMQMTSLVGARRIYAVDLIDKRLNLSQKLGTDITINPRRENPIKRIREETKNKGADVVIETSGNPKALRDAIKCTRYLGTILVLSFYVQPASDIILGEEFHHNQLRLVQAQAMGLPSAPLRAWDRERNIDTFMHLLKTKRIKVEEMITHKIPFEKAQEAFELIDKKPENLIKAVLTF